MAKMDRRNVFWNNLLGEDKVLLGNLANAENELGKKIPHGINLNLSALFYGSNEDFEEIERANDLMSRYIKYKLSALIEYPATGQKHFVQRSDDLDGDLVPLVNGRIDSTATADGSVHEVCDIKQKFPTALVFSRNGRHRVEHVRRLRCLLCISCKKISKQTWRNRMKLKKVLINNVTRVSKRSPIIKECSLIDYYYYRGKISHPITKVTVKNSSKSNINRKLSSNVKLSKKRRLGTVENPLFSDLSICHSVQHLIQYFSKLFEERKFVYENGSLETVRVDSSSEKVVVEFPELPTFEGSSRHVRKELKMDEKKDAGGVEDNEKEDDVRFPKIPMLRSTSRSPQSDEGIEPDPEQRRAFVARCWSVDSAVPSDDESFQNLQQQKGNEFRVTRCWSSDSAVLSDDEQNKAWGSSNSTETAEAETNDGHPRYWRTPSVVVSDFSDYSYLEEKFERSNVDDKCDDNSASPSQASSCSCLDCDEIRQSTENSLSLDFHLLQICRHRRHSDSCCLCIDAKNSASQSNANRRNSCLACPTPYYPKLTRSEGNSPTSKPLDLSFRDNHTKSHIEFLDIPTNRKISDCSTNSSLSGDDCEITELQPINHLRTSGWRKLRNIVHWTPFFQTYKKQRYPWVQLAGHQGNFRAGPTPGTILKKLCPQEEACFRLLMRDVLRPYVPEFKGVLDVREAENGTDHDARLKAESKEAEVDDRKPVVSSYLQLQDLLGDFEQPCVMDCKVGVRTYLESELAKAKERPKLRKDMYEKMVQVDPTAPTAEECRVEGVTKPRYMVWRETISSTATLGFRVEGIKRAEGSSTKDFKTTRTLEQVTEALKRFTEGYPHAVPKYLQRLKAIRATLKASAFFATHEVVGSSLLFVHDAKNASIWMIDFAKTLPLPAHLPRIRHDAEWQVGNHEDGYLIGINNLINIFQDIRNAEA